MKKLLIYNKHKAYRISDLLLSLKNNSTIIMLLLLLISGIIIGTTVSYSVVLIRNVIITYISSVDSAYDVFLCNSLLYSLNYIFLFIFGLCSVGIPFILLVPIICGAGYGCLFSIFYGFNQNSGIIMFLLLKLPSAIVYIITIIISVSVSLIMNSELNSNLFHKTKNKLDLRSYCISYSIILFFGLVSALIDTFMYMIFNSLYR